MVNRVPLDLNHAMELGDGELNALFKQQMKRLAQDIDDRPGDPSKRKLTLTFELQPIVGTKTGQADNCHLTVKCVSSVPDYRTPQYDLVVTTNGFLFNTEDSSNADQHALPFKGEDKE